MEMNWIRKTTDFICRQASTDRKTEGKTTQNDNHKKEKLIIDRHSIYIQRLQAIAMKKDKKKIAKWKKRKQKTTTPKARKKLTPKITRSKFWKIGGMVNFNATTFLVEMSCIRKTTDFICRQASTERKTEGKTTQNDKHKQEKLIIAKPSIYIYRGSKQ